jgi:hypothetical protein
MDGRTMVVAPLQSMCAEVVMRQIRRCSDRCREDAGQRRARSFTREPMRWCVAPSGRMGDGIVHALEARQHFVVATSQTGQTSARAGGQESTMSLHRSSYRRLAIAAGAISLLAGSLALRAEEPGVFPGPAWNRSAAVDAPYGRCSEGGAGSAMGNKLTMVFASGFTAANVIAIQELHCRPYSGGQNGPKSCASIPEAGAVPYAYCVEFFNDGLGNDIAVGVLERDRTTDALGDYAGCPDGQQPQAKLPLAQQAGFDPRRISGLVTLTCGPAQGAHRQAHAIHCPKEPHPYSACVGTENDGHGNAVTLGIVRAHGPGDPYGLFGECNSNVGIKPGFTAKADALTEAGLSLDNVRVVDQLYCAVPWGLGGWLPDHFENWACGQVPGLLPSQAARFDTCVVGTDRFGNGAIFGVHLAH